MNASIIIMICGLVVLAWAAVAARFLFGVRSRRIARERHDNADFTSTDLTPAEAGHLRHSPRLREGEVCYLRVRNHAGERTTIHVREDGSMVRYWNGGSVLLDVHYGKRRPALVDFG